jgi:hypothetical protein
MLGQVRVVKGVYAKKPVENQVFTLLRPVSIGKKGPFITVDGSELTGQRGRNARILLESQNDVVYLDGDNVQVAEEAAPARPAETKEEAKARIRKRFDIINKMTNAMTDDVIRGLIISGPAGVGKSYGVEQILTSYEIQNRLATNRRCTYEVIKGTTTPIGLYKALYDNSEKGQILVLDDCEVHDEQCLNMLKAVLDTGKKRRVSWRAESRALKAEEIPNDFDFEGAVIFITNLNFDTVRSPRISAHLKALQSRCHYIDLELDTIEDCFLRIEQIVGDGMLEDYNFGPAGEEELIQFMRDNGERLREVSLRMVIKIADLKKMDPQNWMDLALSTCCKRSV